MAVTDKRNRYIAFEIVGGKTSRREMIRLIRENFSQKEYQEIEPWLTVFTGKKGIVRCNHTGKEKAVKILNDISVKGGRVKTVTTSGTIKKAKKRLLEDE